LDDKRVSPLDLEDVMKISEIAKKVKVNSNTVTRWCNKGYFPNAFRVGSSWRIPRADVENYIRQQTEKEIREGS
jgi:excisionase family DNA binding protein